MPPQVLPSFTLSALAIVGAVGWLGRTGSLWVAGGTPGSCGSCTSPCAPARRRRARLSVDGMRFPLRPATPAERAAWHAPPTPWRIVA